MALTPTNAPKIECRFCGCKRSKVVTSKTFDVTYYGKARTIIKRYRICGHCGLQFTTIETYEDEENTNLPEDIQPFRPAPPEKPGVYKHTPSIPKASGHLPPTDGDRGQDGSFPPKKPAASRRKTRKKE